MRALGHRGPFLQGFLDVFLGQVIGDTDQEEQFGRGRQAAAFPVFLGVDSKDQPSQEEQESGQSAQARVNKRHGCSEMRCAPRPGAKRDQKQ